MAKATNIQTADHYTWGQNCDGWRLLMSDTLTIIQERMPPGTSEVRHRHTHSRQFFYVLSGELTMEVERETLLLTVGDGLEIPPGQAHQAFNHGVHDVDFLVTSQPPSQNDRHPA